MVSSPHFIWIYCARTQTKGKPSPPFAVWFLPAEGSLFYSKGVWVVAPVSGPCVDIVLIKLHTAWKGPPTATMLLPLHWRTQRKYITSAIKLNIWTLERVTLWGIIPSPLLVLPFAYLAILMDTEISNKHRTVQCSLIQIMFSYWLI